MTAAWLALAVNTLGAVYSFGVRSYLAWRATGDTGLRLSVDGRGSATWWAKVAFVAALVLSLTAPAAALLGLPVLAVPAAVTVAGGVLALAGAAMVAVAQSGMGASWRVGVDPGEHTELVVGGLFRLSRNPIFTAMLAVAAGTVLLVPGIISVAALFVLLVAVQLQVRVVEEPYLLSVHGQAYRRYTQRVGRFVPLLGRNPSVSQQEVHDVHDHDHDGHDTDHAGHRPDGPDLTYTGNDHDGHSHDGHGHGHDGHSHGVSADSDGRWLAIALTVIVAFMAVEVVVGLISGSLALISDAAHMLTDAAAIVLALITMRIAARPARGRYTFGLARAEIISAALNGLSLLLLAAWLTYEAVERLADPPAVTGWMVVVTGLIGLAVNVVAAWAISKANRSSLNVEGAYQHVLMDMFASIAATAAGVVVMLTGFVRADAIATLVVVALMVKGGWSLLRESGRVLLNAAPADVRPDAVAADMLAVADVVEIHDLHVWTIASGQAALSAHVIVEVGTDCHLVRDQLERRVAAGHQITHTTLQVDHRVEAAEHCAISHGEVHRR
ncbi:cation diffusion facilitator family transporter [Catellatospora methionotrophica]|uniref:cation diffusion facilitator family transporter n=1 Tax=Catellatospora methionotrophica TaxID=121620 RepID=UPI0033F077EC